ncbi:PREDICTED: formin-2-like [Priapulus caudatus]|uniref:Formin-2-like n=1 Tax=Priapulus caudatus TaxID=37621 RepID=A0ABM1EN46_PRICU|nr:PREDICTED: formin-2-like [Priapulus caudatus]
MSSGAPVMQRGPRKSLKVPKAEMKPLFWNRIQLHDLHKIMPELPEGTKTLWEELEEPQIDVDEFEVLFSKKQMQPKKKKTAESNKKQVKKVIKILDQKRSQGLGIVLSSLHIEISDVESTLLNVDTTLLDYDRLQKVYENRPEAEELKAITDAVEKNKDEQTALDKPEQFLYDLAKIPNYLERIHCIIYQSSFMETISALESKLSNFRLTCQVLLTGRGVQRMMSLILAIGNYMNGGSRTRGQADGFNIEILPKLRDVKSQDNSSSLLNYVVRCYLTLYEPNGDVEGAKFPLPEPLDVSQAALVNFDDVSNELKKIRKELDACEKQAARVVEGSTEETRQPFQDVMEKFFQKANLDHKDQKESFEECQSKFADVCMFFSWKPRTGKDPTAKDFFSQWQGFVRDFKDVWKKEQQRIAKKRVDEAKQLLKQKRALIQKPPTQKARADGLKARLARKGKI